MTAKKNITIRTRENCCGTWWDTVLYDGKKILMEGPAQAWVRKYAAIRNAKALAKQVGIPYSDKIYKERGC